MRVERPATRQANQDSRPIHRRAGEWLLVVFCVALALWTYRTTLSGYFSPDDLQMLEKAKGLLPGSPALWRWLSGTAYYQVVGRWFGSNPHPYFLVNWILHGINVILLYALARRAGGGWLAALVAAGLFGASRLFLTVVGQAVGIGELLALGLVLASAIALTYRGPWSVALAALLFGLALSAKESVLLLPIAMLLLPATGDTWRVRVRRVAPLIAIAIAAALYLVTVVRSGPMGGAIYETRFGVNLFHSLMSYVDWSIDLQNVTPDFYGEISTTAWKRMLPVVLGLMIAAWFSRRRSPLPWLGALWWALALAPVLPLMWQRYLHYLYAPWAGLSLAIGGLAELLVPRGVRLVAGGLAVALLIAYAGHSDGLIRTRLTEHLHDRDLPLDPFSFKKEVIRRVAVGVGAAGPQGSRIVLLTPNTGGTGYHDYLHSILDKGRALRVLFTNLDSVAIVDRWTPDYRGYELFLASADGRVEAMGRGPEANLRVAQILRGSDFLEAARDHLVAAVEAYPDDVRLRQELQLLAASNEPR